MSRIMAIAWLRIMSVLYDKKSYIFFIGLPILFTMIFGSIVGGDGEKKLPTVGLIITESTSEATEQWTNRLYQQIQTSNDFLWIKGEHQELLDAVQTGSIIAAVEAFSTAEIVIWKRNQLAEHIQLEALLQLRSQELAIVSQMVTEEEVRKQLEREWQQLSINYSWEPFRSTQTLEQNSEQNLGSSYTSVTNEYMQASMAIGFVIMFMMMYVITGAGIVIQEKAQGTWNRLVMAPLKPTQIFFGYGLGFVVIGWLQFAIVMMISSFLFGIRWGNLGSVVVIVTLFLIAIVSMGLLLSLIVKNFKQQQTIGSIIVIASSMLAGIFWPLEIASKAMQSIAIIAPQYWAFEGLKGAMLLQKTVPELIYPITILALFAGVFYFGWYTLYRKTLKES